MRCPKTDQRSWLELFKIIKVKTSIGYNDSNNLCTIIIKLTGVFLIYTEPSKIIFYHLR